MELNFKEMQAAAEQHIAEQQEAFMDAMQKMSAHTRKKQEAMDNLLRKAGERESERKRQEMETKIEEESEAAISAIREKYRKSSPAEWNENDVDKALKRLVATLAK